jgi:uncharacterized protein (AIM24 family)
MPPISSRSLHRLAQNPRQFAFPAHFIAGRRLGGYKYISVQATPSTDKNTIDVNGKSLSASSPGTKLPCYCVYTSDKSTDATFEILGAPYSLLSATLSPSQSLFTRRGTLVGLSSASPDSTISTLRLLTPFRRALTGVPFLYQRITSTTPISALISTPSTHTTFSILHLDGTTDWRIPQRTAVLAWTGNSLSLSPTLPTSLSAASWGNTLATGRGLLALSGRGQIYSITLGANETYIAHPSNILAYSSSSPSPAPTPYRFKSSSMRMQIPLALGNWFPTPAFIRAMQDASAYKILHNALLRIRTWSRRTIWGDRLFLRFQGPTTILVQSRAARVADVLSRDQVNEIADTDAGVVTQSIRDVQGVRDQAREDQKRMGVQGATTSAATKREGAEKEDVVGKTTKLEVSGVEDGKATFKAVQRA